MKINDLGVITSDVIETARSTLVIGPIAHKYADVIEQLYADAPDV